MYAREGSNAILQKREEELVEGARSREGAHIVSRIGCFGALLICQHVIPIAQKVSEITAYLKELVYFGYLTIVCMV